MKSFIALKKCSFVIFGQRAAALKNVLAQRRGVLQSFGKEQIACRIPRLFVQRYLLLSDHEEDHRHIIIFRLSIVYY